MQLGQVGGLALCLVLCACSGDDAKQAAANSLSLVTLNNAIGVGLAPYAPERLDAIIADLPGLGADVLCLQELWQPVDMDRLTLALAAEYPYTQRAVQVTGGAAGAACSKAEADSLLTCLNDQCAGVENAGLPLCAIASCADAFSAVSMSCQQCVIANQAADDVQHLVQICSAADGEAASYQDQNGLLLLSKLPLVEPDFLRLESALGDRGVLSARIDTGLAGPVRLYCTHLAATLSEVPYTGPYGSWQGERVEQIERWLGWVDETRGSGERAVLMGDLNCGPETALAHSASPDAYARFIEAGFEDPYADDDGRCTFCGSNPLNAAVGDPDEGALIDHILFSGTPSSLTSLSASLARTVGRVLDQPIEVEAGGSTIETAHSDHYGVQVTLSRERP
jgi:endonuclease/exonuclease/phosphatase family metal-dependent hydrolase